MIRIIYKHSLSMKSAWLFLVDPPSVAINIKIIDGSHIRAFKRTTDFLEGVGECACVCVCGGGVLPAI